TANELDRILKFMRRSYERSDYSAQWQSLVKDEYTVNDEAVQIAIIDRDGMMITSTAMLYPPAPVDLSDREHFLVHKRRQTDELFISKPVMGRASGKWSVQFTRPYWDRNREFAGVVVVSLDPSHLTRAYSDLRLGQGHGLALIGTDGIVRSGAGALNGTLGTTEVRINSSERMVINGAVIASQDMNGVRTMVARRDVSNYPLRVIVTANEPTGSVSSWRSSGYVLSAAAFSLVAFFGMMTSAVYSRRFQANILHLARHDSLTGLPNRLFLNEQLETALATTRPHSLALMIIDLDGFKDVNDTHGHPVGDKLLVEVGRRLLSTIRRSDHLARLGGDEFAIVQRLEMGADDANALAARIVSRMSKAFEIDGRRLVIGASVGVAVFEEHVDAAELMKRADMALYASKAEGRRTHRFYRPQMDALVRQRSAMFEGLRDALSERRFEIHYQPLVTSKGREVTCYEALLRWKDGERGYVSPAQFIPLAEETGLIIPIGAWVLEQACRDALQLPDHVRVAVNCSAVQLQDGKLVDTVRRVLATTGLSPNRLELEITESVLMNKSSPEVQQLRELAAMGVSLALDDFGTGYSSLSYLEAYPVNYLKIDRSFVIAMEAKESTLAIVQMIISLAHCLNIRTVAEGVETSSQFEMLRALGCDEIQGYFISKPGPAAEILNRDYRVASSAGRTAA
ncbi:MAG TPA: EAL domain-containing protein, partial [Beijerinckiaceae bacterium]